MASYPGKSAQIINFNYNQLTLIFPFQYAETNEPGLFKVWALVEKELHQIKLTVPRIFYVNQRTQREEESGVLYKKANRILPRSRPGYHLYEYTVPEAQYREHSQELTSDLSSPDIEGIYETQVSLEFRILLRLGCICTVDRAVANRLTKEGMKDIDSFSLEQLNFKSIEYQPYLQKVSYFIRFLNSVFHEFMNFFSFQMARHQSNTFSSTSIDLRMARKLCTGFF